MWIVSNRWLLGLLPTLLSFAALGQTDLPASSAMPKIYVAGPYGFSEAGRDFHYRVLIPELTRLGYAVLDPWKLTEQSKIDKVVQMPYGENRRSAWEKLNPEIAQNNQHALDECDGVLAVLDGADVDSGTAAEIGYAYRAGKPIMGYRGDFRLASDNEGAIVNLQVEHFIRASGGTIVKTVQELSQTLPGIIKSKQKQ